MHLETSYSPPMDSCIRKKYIPTFLITRFHCQCTHQAILINCDTGIFFINHRKKCCSAILIGEWKIIYYYFYFNSFASERTGYSELYLFFFYICRTKGFISIEINISTRTKMEFAGVLFVF